MKHISEILRDLMKKIEQKRNQKGEKDDARKFIS